MPDTSKAELYKQYIAGLKDGSIPAGVSFDQWLGQRGFTPKLTFEPLETQKGGSIYSPNFPPGSFASRGTFQPANTLQNNIWSPAYEQLPKPNLTPGTGGYEAGKFTYQPNPSIAPSDPMVNYTEQLIRQLLGESGAPSTETTTPPTGGEGTEPNYEDWYDEDGHLHHWDIVQGDVTIGYDPSKATGKAPTTPTAPPPDPPAAGYEWYWDGDQWAQRKSDVSGAGTTGAPPYQAPPGYHWKQKEDGTWRIVEGDYTAPTSAVDTELLEIERQKLAAQQQQSMWQMQYQQQQVEQERQRQLADLRANPQSWLQYSLQAKETPVVQPWMVPLSPEQYGWGGVQVGQALPNWEASTDQESLQGKLPPLLSPSAQYFSRIAPSARQQYFGYQKALTGATPEDTQWSLWSKAPPSGRNTGLNWGR